MNKSIRSGSLKQTNKPFKSGKHASKGALKRKSRGKVNVKNNSNKSLLTEQKEQRKNKAKQKRNVKRDKLQEKYRSISMGDAPPRVVSIIPLGNTDKSSKDIHNLLYKCANNNSNIDNISKTFIVNKWKQRLTILPCERILTDIIYGTQTANIILFLIPDSGIDNLGYETLRIIRAEGFPSMMAGIERGMSVQKGLKKSIEKQLSYEFSEKSFKVGFIDNMDNILRGLCQISLKDDVISRYIPRPYIMAEDPPIFFQDNDSKGMEISGYLRGGSLNANQLLHFPGFGDYQIHAILSGNDPNPMKQSKSSMNISVDKSIILDQSNPDKRESLQSDIDIDPLDSEQTMWDNNDDSTVRDIRKVPRGTSAYQATWILEDGDDLPEDNINSQDIDDSIMNIDENNIMNDNNISEDEEDSEEYDYIDINESFNENERKRQLEQEDLDYPDEVETPNDIPARLRFQKYRGLKSFRTSPWDPKEELPKDYARIVQYKSLTRTQNRILDEHTGISSGTFIIIQVLDVPQLLVETYKSGKPLIGFGLFPFERKISVLNFAVRRTTTYSEPIQSKDELIFVCGGRTLVCNPLFSENISNCDKHKYERFWMQTTSSVATIYGPTMFKPTTVLIFKKVKEEEDIGNAYAINNMILVGSGSLLSVNPDRLNIKKVALTGEPFKVHKRKAVIRKMFFNPEDILWFKPVELRTRLGHTGNILESIGTHGHMRCQFEQQLKQHDVIMMNLYKRVYPKWKSSYLLQEQNSEHNI